MLLKALSLLLISSLAIPLGFICVAVLNISLKTISFEVASVVVGKTDDCFPFVTFRFGLVDNEEAVLGDVEVDEIGFDQFLEVESSVFAPVAILLDYSLVEVSELEI